MTDYPRIAAEALTDAERDGAISAEALTPAQVLLGVKRYFADVAADAWEDQWRVRLSTLEGVSPLAASLVAAEWLVKGPEALAVLAGRSSEFIETEAQVISMFSPSTAKTPQDVAVEVATRFRFWVDGGMLLTSLRRATQHRIWAQSTPEACEQAFMFMRTVAEELIAMTLAGATKEAVLARMVELAGGA